MKQYRVSRVSVMEPYRSSLSTMTTCVREFDSLEEALDVIKIIRKRFPNSEIMPSGNLGRRVEWIKTQTINGMEFSFIQDGSIFWMILEHGDGLPMPIYLI